MMKPKEEPPAVQICVALTFALAFVGFVYLSVGVVHLLSGNGQSWFGPYDPVEYIVAIAAVFGLDPAKDLHGRPPVLLYPAFNLTLRVASPATVEDRECVKPGTTVEVSYPRPSGVQLATGTVPAFCVDVGERREEGSIIAWGDGVRLPGLVLDSLAADGVPEFGFKLTPPLPEYCGSHGTFCFGTVDVISCWAKVGGGPSRCSVSKERITFLPVPVPRSGVKESAANLPQPTP